MFTASKDKADILDRQYQSVFMHGDPDTSFPDMNQFAASEECVRKLLLKSNLRELYSDSVPVTRLRTGALVLPFHQAERTYPKHGRYKEVPRCWPIDNPILEVTHRQDLQEVQQHSQVFKTQLNVLQRGHKCQRLLQYGSLQLGLLLFCLEPTPERIDQETRDDAKNSCLVHNKPIQKHQQRVNYARASAVGVSWI